MIEDFDDEVLALQALEPELNALAGFAALAEDDLLTEEAVRLGYSMGLMSGVSVSAMEQYGMGDVPSTEALLTSIKDKMREWAAKAVASIKVTNSTLKAKLTALIDKITSKLDAVLQAVKSGKVKATKTIKAHPYATVAAALAAAVAVGAVVATCTGTLTLTGGTAAIAGAVQTITRAIGSLKVPFGKFSVSNVKNMVRVTFQKTPVQEVTGTIEGLGFSNDNIASIGAKLSTVQSGTVAATGRLASAYTREANLVNNVAGNPVASKAASRLGVPSGGLMGFLRFGWSVIVACYTVVKTVVMGAMNLVSAVMMPLSTGMMAVNMAKSGIDAAKQATQSGSDEPDENEAVPDQTDSDTQKK